MKPRLSIVIPCYNHGQYIEEALSSVRAANRQDLEVIVVDDGSTDLRTQQEMERLSHDRSLIVIRQANGGLAAARNAGVERAAADYILPLDADNRVRPAYIERGIEIMDSDPRVGVVYGDAEFFGSRSGIWRVGPFDRDRLLEWNYIDACAVIRKEVWTKNGGYRRGMPVQGLEDWEFWMNTLSHGWHFRYVPEVMFDYRVMPGSMIERARGQAKATEDFIADHYGRLYRAVWMERASVRRTAERLVDLIRQRLSERMPAVAPLLRKKYTPSRRAHLTSA